MAESPPQIDARSRRLQAYLRYNRYRIFVDVTILFTWLIITWTVSGVFDLPRWLFYILLFAGVIIYSRITPTWERPYRSPDIDK